jgi:hypothetical protein
MEEKKSTDNEEDLKKYKKIVTHCAKEEENC